MQIANGGRHIASPAIYTVDEAATLLGISRGMAYQFVNEGVIPAKRIGRRWVIPRATFHAWLNASGDLPEAV